jgi:hypothetical protein
MFEQVWLRHLARSVVTFLVIGFSATEAQAQKLTIQGDRFAVDGTPRFLTFISYFGAMDAPNVTADLHLLKSLGFDGVRIWPNLDTGPQLMNGDGSLRPNGLTQLRSILDQAHLEHLVVDVTFTYEHVAGMTPATARIGIMAATDALRSHDNLLFDIQNERNVQDRRFMSEADVASILAGIKATDSARIAFASNSPVDDAAYAAAFATRLGLDVTAYHEPRPVNWYQLNFLGPIVRTMRSNGKPAYLQEPMTTRDSLYAYPSNSRVEYFLQAIANAKLSGAAAWCFHTEVGVDFRTGPPFMEDRLRAYPEPEWAFVNAVNARVALQTSNGTNYVVAEGGGGAGVRADHTAASPGSWEMFGVVDLAGGPVISGDHIALATNDGRHYLQAAGGGGGGLLGSSTSAGPFETFTVEKPGGGVIHNGDAVSLRAGDSSWYVGAIGGGGGAVNVNSGSRGSWETFTVLFATPHITETSPATSIAAGIKKR